MFKGKITKLTSGTAMLGVAPTLALQAQGGVDVASKEVANRFLQEGNNVSFNFKKFRIGAVQAQGGVDVASKEVANRFLKEGNNASFNFKKFGIGAVITILVACVGWYASCVIFNKLALERLREGCLKAENLAEKRSMLEKEKKELEEKISAYKNVSHDAKIDENDPLKELKQKIKEHKAKIEANKKIDFEKVKKEYNNFFDGGEYELQKRVTKLSAQWKDYEKMNNIITKIKEIYNKLEQFEDSSDLLIKGQNAKIKYEKVKKKREEGEKIIKEDNEKKYAKAFEDEKKTLVSFLENVLEKKSETYKEFARQLRQQDEDEIGKKMVDLKEAINFITSYKINSSDEDFKRLLKYKEGISKQLEYKDKPKEYRGFELNGDKYCEVAKGVYVPVFWDSPLMNVGKKYKQDIVSILEEVKGHLKNIIEYQEKAKKASDYSKRIDSLGKLESKLKNESEILQKECEVKGLNWKDFKKAVDDAKEEFSKLEKKFSKKMYKEEMEKIDDSGLGEYFEQFEKLGKIISKEIISIKKGVAGKIKDLDNEVQELKPEKTKEKLEQEIKERKEYVRNAFNEAKRLQEEAKKSKEELQKELKELENLKSRKHAVSNKSDKQNLDVSTLEQKEKELSEKIYKFNINPMKYYNEVNELLAD